MFSRYADEDKDAELLKQKNPKKKIIVAVIDSGIDTAHEDLKPVLWRNEKEIPAIKPTNTNFHH